MSAPTPDLLVPDLLVLGGDVVTMDASRTVWRQGGVAVAGGAIVAVDKAATLRARWPQVPVLEAEGGLITPGLINAHQHLTGDPLVRSLIPDRQSSDESIFGWAVPIHGAHSADDDELSATLSAVESLKYGTTTVVEAGTVAHPRRVAAGLARVGIRGAVGCWGWDIDNAPYAAPADEVLARQQAVLDALPRGGLVEGWVTLVGHDLASDVLLAGAADLARRRGVGMTMHISPTEADVAAYLRRSGRRPLLHLADLGVLGPHLLLAHAVWLDDAEVAALLASDTAVAYCPWAYLRLAQGVSRAGRHAEIVQRGGRMALGCDAPNAGDLPDIHRAATLAAGLARDMSLDAHRFGADTAFALATIEGARAIGMADRVGSLEVGKRADLVVHDPRSAPFLVAGDPALHLVWGTDGRSVRDVVVEGRVVVRDGRCLTVDEDALRQAARESQAALLARAGITPRGAWPVR
ncbi:amidohydrolase family protein [Nitrospirillum iridis]|uniref:5-methylthioadenosine/S-adenosylhomocysteine deaminase n=1 Tax=Nitrospirillum iridis TaxID=765888 RepID=A0A7X0EF05_9PROT|nr:amidohydrolase family protein [Nitrospirillum iridis]MBB6251999.1 5-methylthioadenosine/S-adenosylhomocysteine deaminase [Nitrospirillum iridis]